MKDQIHIRTATEKDFEKIFLIMTDILVTHVSTDEILKLKMSSERRFLKIIRDDNAFFFVAELKNEIIGFLNGAPPLALWNIPERKTFVIEEMAVHSSIRSKGIGSELIKFIENYTKKKGFKKIAASSNISRTKAHRFYINNNF